MNELIPIKNIDVAVVGGGPAGLAAAAQAHKAGASVLVIERDRELGGILTQCIHNGFGLHFFGEELTGPEYAQRFIDELPEGVEIMLGTMALSLNDRLEMTVVGMACGLMRVRAKAVVLAMGCRERTRGALSIPGSRPAGIYTAGSAQRLVNLEGYMPGRRAVVLGSGDIGLIMARRMTWEGAKVMEVLELMPYSSGLNRNIVQCLKDNDIPLHFNHTVVGIHGRERLTSVTVARVDEATKAPIPGTEREIECDTLLLSVGLIPENELTRDAGAQIDPVTQGAVVDETRQTSIPGVFACGNVLHVHDLVDNVSVEAILAGGHAAAYASGRGGEGEAHAVTNGGENSGTQAGADASTAAIRHIKPGTSIRYAVPQRLSPKASGPIDVYFRVTDAFRGSSLIITRGGELVKSLKKRIMTPGEMEKIVLDVTGEGDIELSVQPAQAAQPHGQEDAK